MLDEHLGVEVSTDKNVLKPGLSDLFCDSDDLACDVTFRGQGVAYGAVFGQLSESFDGGVDLGVGSGSDLG